MDMTAWHHDVIFFLHENRSQMYQCYPLELLLVGVVLLLIIVVLFIFVMLELHMWQCSQTIFLTNHFVYEIETLTGGTFVVNIVIDLNCYCQDNW